MNKSRTKSDIIDTSAMLREEKEYYKEIIGHLDAYRKGVLVQLFKGDLPLVDESFTPHKKEHLTNYSEDYDAIPKEEMPVEEKGVKSKELMKKFSNVDAPTVSAEKTNDVKKAVSEEKKELDPIDMAKVRFLHAVPKFIWKDMKEYGPFKQGQESEIFPEIADLLVRKGRAEKV